MKYIIEKSVDGQFFFTLRSKNGQKIVTSETYHTKQGCRKGINAVRKAILAGVEDRA